MKTLCFITMIAVFLLISLTGLQAQTTQTKLDQVELMKQFLGTWTGEMGKDTTAILEYALFGTALECNFKIITKDKIIESVKNLVGYDKENDKIIQAQLWKSSTPDIILYAQWFTSKNIFEVVLLKDISNPENAAVKWKIEFKSADLWEMTSIQNNKVVSTLTFTREKK